MEFAFSTYALNIFGKLLNRHFKQTEKSYNRKNNQSHIIQYPYHRHSKKNLLFLNYVKTTILIKNQTVT